jgi:hypothetical protein
MTRLPSPLALCVVFVACAVRPVAALPGDPAVDAASPITEITLQRTWCYGRCPIDEVVLRADGTAAFTGKGNVGRTGQFRGTFWKGEFDQLSKWLDSQGFFGMKDSYGSANIDASDQIISIVRDGKRKTVTNHWGGSLVFWGMERAIRGIAADITWQPETSGIKGVATWRPKPGSEFPGPPAFRAFAKQTITVRAAGDKQEFRLATDQNGRFEIALRPGTYTVEIPSIWRDSQTAAPQTVAVQPDKFSDVTFTIDRMAEQTKP